jgi:FKBP-type peptidyl-prolyl cis-trans isomerase
MNKIILYFTFLCSVNLLGCNADGISGSEEKKINEYIESKKLIVTETTSTGLRYIRTQESPAGASLERGQSITVNYAGRLLSDKEFDAGTFSFVLGIGQVVKGFDEGIAKMKVGEKATIIFPSNLGYGNQKQGPIPKNSPLVFDIEVLRAN